MIDTIFHEALQGILDLLLSFDRSMSGLNFGHASSNPEATSLRKPIRKQSNSMFENVCRICSSQHNVMNITTLCHVLQN